MDHQRKTEYEPRTAWGKWVLDVLRRHKSGFRQQRQRTGVPHSTVVNWVQDIPPRPEGVRAFAAGFDEDVDEALRIAGYEPIRDERPPLTVIREASRTLTYDPDLAGVTVQAYTGDAEILPEDHQVMEQILRAMLAEKRRLQGRE